MALPQLKKKLPVKQAAAPVEAAEEQEQEVVAAKPVAKKTVPGLKKAVVAKPEPEEAVEEPTEEEQEEAADEAAETGEEAAGEEATEEAVEEAGEEEQEQAAAPAKKTVTVKKTVAPVAKKTVAAKPTAAPAKKAAKGDEPKAKTLFGAARQPRQPKDLPEEGAIIPRDEFLRQFAEKEGVTIADARRTLEKFESFFLEEIFPKYAVNLFGVKFRRSTVAPRIYAGVGGLEVQTSPLATYVHEHIAIKASIAIGKQSVKGQIDDEGNFVEGNIDSKGNFVEGSWGQDDEGNTTFTPAKAGKK